MGMRDEKNRDGHALGASCTLEMVMGIMEHEGWRGMVETFAKAGHANVGAWV